MKELAGQLAIVTGASRGIGAAAAARLHQLGAHVVRIARSLDDGDHERMLDVRCDLTGPSAPATLDALLELGPPHIVVSNAGAFTMAPLHETSTATFDAQVAVNLRAPFLVAQAFLPAMRQAGRGVFVQVGSIADHVGFPGNSAYAASKYGLRGLHESLVAEYRGSRVRLCLVSPGPTDTAVWDPVDPDTRPYLPDRAEMLRPADVAEAIAWVAMRPAHVHVDWLRLGPA
jgi:NAD(P)-dependent dehydrogenase (short-subunit alcohol dehydrogenase family)